MTNSRDPNSIIYIGFWKRFLAYFIDGFVMLIPYLILEVAVDSKIHPVLNGVIQLASSLIYTAGLQSSSWQATVGKKVLGLIVVDEYGERITFKRATGRFFAEILSMLLLCIGFMMIGWTKHKQGLHDKIAKTFVIKK